MKPIYEPKGAAKEYGDFASKVAAYCIGKRGGLCSMPKLSDINEE